MPASLESARPIMAPSVSRTAWHPPSLTTDSAHAELRDIESGLDRMENKALTSQRVELSEEKSANLSKLALGAKLERALDRRMSSQDAVMRRPPAAKLSEKQAI
ncbi:conserved hypothetical protein [Verticillium alfalfae VaMs.102]|uniref:Uncharacterized protein n=1 Tax=Verticillium alfalfae (strain VaMs.102 / ATCC MYA-4576 / FGSC 10136) TaxID=526221 RepID=C9SVZ5_VERA1|nr:conserved hypothetical protein [Verticillium alfalfae VaMs.102]EEY22960.1 conserved hypothetical protein [Verticillium alfalfae VaMs.102]